jgi:hypothetical protein
MARKSRRIYTPRILGSGKIMTPADLKRLHRKSSTSASFPMKYAQWSKRNGPSLFTSCRRGSRMAKAIRRRRSGWSAKLTRPITLKNGIKLVTLADVRAFILNEPEHIQRRNSWQRAAELMMAAAEGHGTEGATKQIELALFLEARYLRP